MLVKGIAEVLKATPDPTPVPPPLIPVDDPVDNDSSVDSVDEGAMPGPVSEELVILGEDPVPELVQKSSWRKRALRPTLLLAAVFLLNLVETRLDALLTPPSLGKDAGLSDHRGVPLVRGIPQLRVARCDERRRNLRLLLLVLLRPAAAVRVRHLAPGATTRIRVGIAPSSLAVAIDYAVSLPFFIFFPVPERWSFFESEAMLLSDKWSDWLIRAIRPMSGLDNSFPSNHVSLIVLALTACLIFEVPYRKCAIPLGATVVLSTFVLGVHWLPDMLGGLALGIASMLLAWRLTQANRLSFLWGAA